MKYMYHSLTFRSLCSSYSLIHNCLQSKRLHQMTWHKTYIINTCNNTYNLHNNIVHAFITYNIYKLFTDMKCQFFTHMIFLFYMFIFILIKTQSNHRGWSAFKNNTSYIHQDILIHSTLYWLQQQITLPIQYKIYSTHNSYLLKLSIKSSFWHTNYDMHLHIHYIF